MGWIQSHECDACGEMYNEEEIEQEEKTGQWICMHCTEEFEVEQMICYLEERGYSVTKD